MIYLLVILSSILKNIVFEAALGDNLVLEVSQEFHIVVHLASFERQNTLTNLTTLCSLHCQDIKFSSFNLQPNLRLSK